MKSVSLPPILLAHSTSPVLPYFIIIPSVFPLFVSVFPSASIVLLSKYPPAIYPPSLVGVTDLIISLLLPPRLLAHSTSPSLSYFSIIPSLEPLFVRVYSPTWKLPLKYPPAIIPLSLVEATE